MAFVKRSSKYGAKRVEINGVKFASKREGKRYKELIYLQALGEIAELELQPRFPIFINSKLVFTYVADFRYFDKVTKTTVIEDAKGFKTDVYKLKKKAVEAAYVITINEI